MRVRVSFQFDAEIGGGDIKEFAQKFHQDLTNIIEDKEFDLKTFEVEQLDYPEVDIENL